MILMQAHARTGPVAVAGLEKMLHKVPWLLEEVSLYDAVEMGHDACVCRGVVWRWEYGYGFWRSLYTVADT